MIFLFGQSTLWSYLNVYIPVAPGFVTTYAGLATVRAFLGLVEGPLVPGLTLLLSSFYTRKELAFRYVAGLLFWRRPSLRLY